jgi:hypothetical protein
MVLDETHLPEPRIDLAPSDWREHLRGALARGCETATVQATPMAERLYAALGFRDLGRILEYARPAPSTNGVNGR